jgi:hypothetical protein
VLLWPLFARSAWAHSATVVDSTTGEGAALAQFARSAWDQSATVVSGTIDWPLFARSARAQPATVVAGTTRESNTLASVRSVGVGTASLCVGGHDRLRRSYGLCSLGRRGHSQPLSWRA